MAEIIRSYFFPLLHSFGGIEDVGVRQGGQNSLKLADRIRGRVFSFFFSISKERKGKKNCQQFLPSSIVT